MGILIKAFNTMVRMQTLLGWFQGIMRGGNKNMGGGYRPLFPGILIMMGVKKCNLRWRDIYIFS